MCSVYPCPPFAMASFSMFEYKLTILFLILTLLRIFQEEMSKVESRCKELQGQNTLLHEQIQAMSSKMAANLQRAVSEVPMNISLTEEEKSQDQLLEILR